MQKCGRVCKFQFSALFIVEKLLPPRWGNSARTGAKPSPRGEGGPAKPGRMWWSAKQNRKYLTPLRSYTTSVICSFLANASFSSRRSLGRSRPAKQPNRTINSNLLQKSLIFPTFSVDKQKINGYNILACVCRQILASGETGGQKSKRRCKQHG